MATVLVAFAIIDGNPTQTSAGNDTSVPPPATELMAPATNAATKTTRYDMVFEQEIRSSGDHLSQKTEFLLIS